MKIKNILSLAILLFFTAVHGQQESPQFKFGLSAGLPTGDFAELHSLFYALEARYDRPIKKESDIVVGGVIEIKNHIGGKAKATGLPSNVDNGENVGVATLAIGGKLYTNKLLFIGTDIGYGFIIGGNRDNGSTRGGLENGGFYYKPIAGLRIKNWEFYGFFSNAIIENVNVNAAGVGFNFGIDALDD